jgi:1,4-dihydroxy-2-naphthoyl-CoA synthase
MLSGGIDHREATVKYYEKISLDVDGGGAATIIFQIPERANALGRLALQETLHALGTCEVRDDAGAVVLTGTVSTLGQSSWSAVARAAAGGSP